MSFSFSAQNLILKEENRDKQNTGVFKKKFNSNIEENAYALEKALLQYPSMNDDARVRFRQSAVTLQNFEYMNPLYLAAAMVLLSLTGNDLNKDLFIPNDYTNDEVFKRFSPGKKITEDVMEELFIYCKILTINRIDVEQEFSNSNSRFNSGSDEEDNYYEE